MKKIAVTVLLLAISGSSLAWKFNSKGSVTDFTPHGTQPGLSFNVQSTSQCSGCHGEFNQNAADLTYLPYSTWAGSMMANSTRDPLFWAAVDIANQDIPGVGEFCIRCHSPSGFYAGNVKDGTGDMSYANGCELSGSLVDYDNNLNDYQGVNCHFCHRVDPQGPANEPFMSGNSNIWLDDENCDNPDSPNDGPCRKGPYNPPLINIHAWEYSPFIQSSEMCSTCHNVSSPEVLTGGVFSYAKTLWDQGVETDIAMPIERTYDEWNLSEFADLIFQDQFALEIATEQPILTQGQSCQSCHMPQSEEADARACTLTSYGSRENDLATHTFAGGNAWMPQVLKAAYGTELDAISSFSRSDAFDRSTQAALDMLQNKSAIIATNLESSDASSIQVSVKVTNLTGHKLPSGYHEGRRLWVNLQVRDSLNQLVYESGAYNETTAVLTEDPDIKVYEAIQGIWNEGESTCDTENGDGKMFHFVLNNCIAKDNRIPPLGFRGGFDIEMKPVNYSYPFRPGSNDQQLVNYDISNYNINIPMGTSLPLSVTATLKYQTSSKEYVEFLANESTTDTENNLCNRSLTVGPADQSRGDFMLDLWNNNGKSAPVDMVSSSINISTLE